MIISINLNQLKNCDAQIHLKTTLKVCMVCYHKRYQELYITIKTKLKRDTQMQRWKKKGKHTMNSFTQEGHDCARLRH